MNDEFMTPTVKEANWHTDGSHCGTICTVAQRDNVTEELENFKSNSKAAIVIHKHKHTQTQAHTHTITGVSKKTSPRIMFVSGLSYI